MKARNSLVFSALLALGCGSSVAPAPEAAVLQPAAAEEPVRIYLMADMTRVGAGQELTLALRFDIAPGWHIFWKNPGDGHEATRVSFTAPEGFAGGELEYPGPERLESTAGQREFGYRDLVLLSSTVVAPSDIEPGAVLEFSAEASWLACRQECVHGEGRAEIELETATEELPSAPNYASTFATHLARLPKPLSELSGAVVRWQSESSEMIARVEGAERLDYFPSRSEHQRVAGRVALGDEIRISYRSAEGGVGGGVLAVTRDGAAAYYELGGVELDRP